jgi:hypothetical protein
MTELNRPMFRQISRKLKVVVRWCEENGIPSTSIRTVLLHPVYGFGQGYPAYVVDWPE